MWKLIFYATFAHSNSKKHTDMRKIIVLLVVAFTFHIGIYAQKSDPSGIIQNDGLFYTDLSQTKLYTGEYKEYYADGALRLQMYIKDGKPEGDYIIYYSNGKPNEIRSYHDGKFNGTWRTYNEAGILISEAVYSNDKKHGTWHVWDDNGIMRYEMHYNMGQKTGKWYMWDEKGKLISEKDYSAH